MQSCCLEGCESYKFVYKQRIGYFKFPLNNNQLLRKWLNQIRLPNWRPTDKDQICSTHFHVDDIDFNSKYPKLKNNAIPMIFPIKHFEYIHTDSPSSVPKNDSKQKIKKINVSENSKNPPEIYIDSEGEEMRNDKSTSETFHPNPYILIITDESETKIPFNSKRSTKELGVLRIQIDKKVNNATSNQSTKNHSINGNNSSNTTSQSLCKNKVEEVEINDILPSKVVVFKFDPSSGKITVIKKEKKEKNSEISDENSNNEESVTTNNLNSSNSHPISENQIEAQNNSEKSSNNKQNFSDIHKDIQNSNDSQNRQKETKKDLQESIVILDEVVNDTKNDTKNAKTSITLKDSQVQLTQVNTNIQPTNKSDENGKIANKKMDTKLANNLCSNSQLYVNLSDISPKRKSDSMNSKSINSSNITKNAKRLKKD